MKKYIVLVSILALFYGCSNTIEFNNPAFQANKEGQTWKAHSFAGDIDFGGFIFQGNSGTEIVQLITTNDTRGVFNLGGNSISRAIFKDAEGTVYSTANNPDPSVSLYPVEGHIEVEDIDHADPKHVIGNFSFTAWSADGLKSVNFIDGVFYNVKLVGGLVAIEN